MLNLFTITVISPTGHYQLRFLFKYNLNKNDGLMMPIVGEINCKKIQYKSNH